MRIMGLDYGSKTVGVALTDPLGITVQPFETVLRDRETKLRRTIARISSIVLENDVGLIVLGLPYNMDGTEGERVQKTLEFKKLLEERCGIKVELQDERLTTVEASEILDEMGVRSRNRKEYIDKIAAAVILEDYLNCHKMTGAADN